MNKTGRPTVLTKVAVRKLEACLKDGMSIRQACWQSGISHDTFYSRCRYDQDFSDKMQAAREHVVVLAKRNIIKAIQQGDTKLSQWWLERRARTEFGISEGQIPEPELKAEPRVDVYDESTLEDVEKLIAWHKRMQRIQDTYIEPEHDPNEDYHFSVDQATGRPPRGI